jgi:hypothetical protein
LIANRSPTLRILGTGVVTAHHPQEYRQSLGIEQQVEQFAQFTMSQQDNFGSGFLLGTLFGGVLGGIVGTIVASRATSSQSPSERYGLNDVAESEGHTINPSEEEMEIARRGLEDKIAQLNSAIDDVRQRLGGTNGYAQTPEDVNNEY